MKFEVKNPQRTVAMKNEARFLNLRNGGNMPGRIRFWIGETVAAAVMLVMIYVLALL